MPSKRRAPPEYNYRPAGTVTWAKMSDSPPPFINRKKRSSPRRYAGIKYERRLHEHFEELYGAAYLASPWFLFGEEGRKMPRWCQPDALLFDAEASRITIVEAKYQHTANAWWQLQMLYYPVVSRAFGSDWSYALAEVVKWYDPSTSFPVTPRLRPRIDEARPGEIAVTICKP